MISAFLLELRAKSVSMRRRSYGAEDDDDEQ